VGAAPRPGTALPVSITIAFEYFHRVGPPVAGESLARARPNFVGSQSPESVTWTRRCSARRVPGAAYAGCSADGTCGMPHAQAGALSRVCALRARRWPIIRRVLTAHLEQSILRGRQTWL